MLIREELVLTGEDLVLIVFEFITLQRLHLFVHITRDAIDVDHITSYRACMEKGTGNIIDVVIDIPG